MKYNLRARPPPVCCVNCRKFLTTRMQQFVVNNPHPAVSPFMMQNFYDYVYQTFRGSAGYKSISDACFYCLNKSTSPPLRRPAPVRFELLWASPRVHENIRTKWLTGLLQADVRLFNAAGKMMQCSRLDDCCAREAIDNVAALTAERSEFPVLIRAVHNDPYATSYVTKLTNAIKYVERIRMKGVTLPNALEKIINVILGTPGTPIKWPAPSNASAITFSTPPVQ